jgi:multidrug efflux pump subunit AcrB
VPEAEKFVVGGSDRWGKPVSVSLLSKNSIEMSHAKEMLEKELETIAALTNISDNSPIGKQEIRIKLKPKAYALGLNQIYIANQVRQGFYGGQAQRLQEGKDEIRVWVRYPKEGRQNMSQFENMRIKTAQGEFPLLELIDYDIERGPVSIKRYNLQKEITVEADLKDPNDDVPPILEKIEKDIMPKIQAKYPGVKYEFMGQMKSSKESAGEMGFYFMIAFFVILLIIMIHFKSYIQSLLIISMVPIGWMGSAWGHGLEGVPISMLSVWGMVALAGVIVNDAVVFLSKYNDLIVEGDKVETAAYNAGIARFRAIMLTTITTSIGLYPLILETSFQAQFLIPMAIALAYGVLFGTMFILIFFPALIVCINDINCMIYRIWTGKQCSKEELEPAMKNYNRSLG